MIMVIFARGGSKGIRKKNLQKINGLSLVARAVIAASKSKCVDRVVVSTDCELISMEAQKFGASIHRRSLSAASDIASTEDAIDDFLSSDFVMDTEAKYIGYIQPTSPFIDPTEIDDAFSMIVSNPKISTIFSSRLSHSFLWKSPATGIQLSDGVNHNFRTPRARRQDLDEVQLLEDGAFYILRKSTYGRTKNRFGDAPYAFQSKINCPVEIDTHFDLEICQQLAPIFDKITFIKTQPKLVLSDFDGVFTSDNVYVDDHGREAIKASRADGQGIKKIINSGIGFCIISSETNEVAAFRAKKMNAKIFLAVEDKLALAHELTSKLNISMDEVCYVGNDVNDLALLKQVGIPLIPLDAAHELFSHGFGVVPRKGGDGVIRLLADLIE